MNFYKNTEIASKYNVSNPTVSNWIQAALEKKNHLHLEEVKGKFKVAKVESNEAEMHRLAKEGVIYKNKVAHEIVEPSPEFYKLLNDEQIIELVNSLEMRREIPPKFTYFGPGAKLWDDFIVKSGIENGSYQPSAHDIILLSECYRYLMNDTSSYDMVNIIEIGPANAYPSKQFIGDYYNSGKLNKYIGIDISSDLLDITERNLKTWFPNLPYESVVADIEHANLNSVFFNAKSKYPGKKVANIILVIGALYGNLDYRRKAWEGIRMSMGRDDYLIYTDELYNNDSRSDYNFVYDEYDFLSWLPRMLNIGSSRESMTATYEDKYKRVQGGFRMDKDYTVVFNIGNIKREVNLYKGEPVYILSHQMFSRDDLLGEMNAVGLSLLHFSTHKNYPWFLVSCKTREVDEV